MGYIMGDNETFCTWGAMRIPFYNSRWSDNEPPPNYFNGKSIHSRTYVNDGDGVDWPPTFFLDESGSLFRTDPVGFNYVTCLLKWDQGGGPPSGWLGTMSWGGLDNQDFEQFLGALLQSPTDSVYLMADANTVTGQYVEFTPPLTINLYPGFTTIEGMTAVT
jgi:hypothetical protein